MSAIPPTIGETIGDKCAGLFARISIHLVTQGRRSWGRPPDGDESCCLYRGPDGTMCAIGCIVPDELYRPDIEGLGLEDRVDNMVETPIWRVLIQAGIPREPEISDLLGKLQEIHDSTPPEDWAVELVNVALSELGGLPVPQAVLVASDTRRAQMAQESAERQAAAEEGPD